MRSNHSLVRTPIGTAQFAPYADSEIMFQFEERTITRYGPCECCGDISLLASGLLRRDQEPYAAYQVHWTKNQIVKHGAEFHIILGEFGDGTTAADKFAVALHFFVEDDRHGFMVVDADQTPIASNPLVGKALPRANVIGTPLAQEVFELVDAIWLDDENIAEVRESVESPSA